ncbi:MAG: 16S rRNA (cytosine(1402)-N(4))-methyltransferase RsmH [Propionibacteriaceae bacterium]|nr:16S rRNA (cytosine(1402)-N(4))-methyltransferase RsmH [Propionibacteriaceae bacterium]
MTGFTDRHDPVLLGRIVELLSPALGAEGAVYVDGTLGLGGHARAILAACPRARLIGIDRDADALAVAAERLAGFSDRITLVQAVYDELPEVLDRLGVSRIQAMLLDLGLSSLQIDRAERGFAYAVDAPLDMRMDARQQLTAAEVVNTYGVADLTRILRRYGEERFADRIARAIVAGRAEAPFVTSARLVQTLTSAIPVAARKTGGHPAKRTFQALRIEVNRELAALERVLPAAIGSLALGGRLAVLSYHSLEDRLVKEAFREGSSDRAPRGLPVVPDALAPQLALLTRGAERPTTEETDVNPRAAAARLRVAVRIKEAP